jgi:hypothetical protein
LLEDADVQIDVRDHRGANALEAAQSKHHSGVISLLRRYRVSHRRGNKSSHDSAYESALLSRFDWPC